MAENKEASQLLLQMLQKASSSTDGDERTQSPPMQPPQPPIAVSHQVTSLTNLGEEEHLSFTDGADQDIPIGKRDVHVTYTKNAGPVSKQIEAEDITLYASDYVPTSRRMVAGNGSYMGYFVKGKTFGCVRVISVKDGNRALLKGLNGSIADMQFCPLQNGLLAVVDVTGFLMLWYLSETTELTATKLAAFQVAEAEPGCRLQWHPTTPGKLCIAAGSAVYVWNMSDSYEWGLNNPGSADTPFVGDEAAKKLPVQTVCKSTLKICDAAFSRMDTAGIPDSGESIAVAFADGFVHVYKCALSEKENSQVIKKFKPFACETVVNSVMFCSALPSIIPPGPSASCSHPLLLVTSNNNSVLAFWDTRSWELVQIIRLEYDTGDAPTLQIAIEPESQFVVLTDCGTGNLFLLHLESPPAAAPGQPRNFGRPRITSVSRCGVKSPIFSFVMVPSVEVNDQGVRTLAAYSVCAKAINKLVISYNLAEADWGSTSQLVATGDGLEDHIAAVGDIDAQQDVGLDLLAKLNESIQSANGNNQDDAGGGLAVKAPDASDIEAKMQAMAAQLSNHRQEEQNKEEERQQLAMLEANMKAALEAKKRKEEAEQVQQAQLQQALAREQQRLVEQQKAEDEKRQLREIAQKKEEAAERQLDAERQAAVAAAEKELLEATAAVEAKKLAAAADLQKQLAEDAEEQARLQRSEQQRQSAIQDAQQASAKSQNDIMNALLTVLSAQSDSIARLTNMVQKQQKQLTLLQGGLAASEENSIHRTEKLFQRYFAASEQRQREGQREFNDAERKKHGALLTAIAEGLHSALGETIRKCVAAEAANSILPLIQTTVANAMNQYVEPMLARGFGTVQHNLAAELPRLLCQDAVTVPIARSVAQATQSGMASAFMSAFQSHLLPSINSACQEIFRQVNTTFNNGTQEYVKALAAQTGGITAASNDISGRLQVLEGQLQTSLQQQQETITTISGIASQVTGSVANVVRQEHAQHLQAMQSVSGSRPGTPKRSAASKPQPPTVQDEVFRLASQGQIVPAFEKALGAADVRLVLALCGKVTPTDFAKAKPSQAVLLSLMQQLANAPWQQEAQQNLSYLMAAIPMLNTQDPVSAKYIGDITAAVDKKLSMLPEDTGSNGNEITVIRGYIELLRKSL